MNDRKRAWQILHTEIRRRADDQATDDTWSTQLGTIIREADSPTRLIIEIAGFGATFALMHRDPEEAKKLADFVGALVIAEPDEDEDDDEDDGDLIYPSPDDDTIRQWEREADEEYRQILREVSEEDEQ